MTIFGCILCGTFQPVPGECEVNGDPFSMPRTVLLCPACWARVYSKEVADRYLRPDREDAEIQRRQ